MEHQAAAVLPDVDPPENPAEDVRLPVHDSPAKRRRRFQWSEPIESFLSLPAEGDGPEALQNGAREWAARQGHRVGNFRSSTLSVFSDWSVVCPCQKHTICREGRGMHFQFVGRQDLAMQRYILSVSMSGECDGDEHVLRASHGSTAGQITAAQREMILREAENLLTRGRQITPAAVRMRLRDEDQIAISAPALSNVLRQRRRLLLL